MMKFVWEENSSCRADFSMANAAKIVKQIFPEAVSPRRATSKSKLSVKF